MIAPSSSEDASAMPPDFATLAERLPVPVRRLLIDNEDPSHIELPALLSALGYSSVVAPATPATSATPATPASYPSLRSLRLLRMAQGLPPEPPSGAPDTTAERDLMHMPGALSTEQCAALRHAVDGKQADSTRNDLVDHLLARPFASQLNLSRLSLEALVGPEAVGLLYGLVDIFHSKRGDHGDAPGVGEAGAQEAAGAEEEEDDDDNDEEPDVEISIRRYSPYVRPWIPFHSDRAYATVNVALDDDRSHAGGHLLAIVDGAVQLLPRAMGEATVHTDNLPHGVSRVTAGARYSLIMFFYPYK